MSTISKAIAAFGIQMLLALSSILAATSCTQELEDSTKLQLLAFYLADYYAPKNSILAGSNSGLYYFQEYRDQNFHFFNSIGTKQINGIATDLGKNILVATSDGVYVSHNNGYTFQVFSNSIGMSWNDVAYDISKGTFGLLRGNNVYISSDGGYTFSGPTTLAISFQKMAMQNDAIFLCGASAAPNNIYRSLDRGQTFTAVGGALPTCNNIYYLEGNGSTLLLASTVSGLYISTDQATNWASPINTTQGLLNNEVHVANFGADGKWYVGNGISGSMGLSVASSVGGPYTTLISSQNVRDVVSSDNGAIVACTTNGLMVSENGGASFLGPVSSSTSFPPSECSLLSFAKISGKL